MYSNLHLVIKLIPSSESDSVELLRRQPAGLLCIHRTLNNFLRKSTYHTQHQLSPNGRATGRDRTPIPHALPFGSPKNNQIPAKRKSYRQAVAKQRDHVGFNDAPPAAGLMPCSALNWGSVATGPISSWLRTSDGVCVDFPQWSLKGN